MSKQLPEWTRANAQDTSTSKRRYRTYYWLVMKLLEKSTGKLQEYQSDEEVESSSSDWFNARPSQGEIKDCENAFHDIFAIKGSTVTKPRYLMKYVIKALAKKYTTWTKARSVDLTTAKRRYRTLYWTVLKLYETASRKPRDSSDWFDKLPNYEEMYDYKIAIQ